jgi:hypothetical protein
VLTHFHLTRILVLAFTVAAGCGRYQAAAQAISNQSPGLTVFYGQVIAMAGAVDAPTGFSLLLKNRLIDFRIAAHVTLKPHSAEAEVEGFQTNDYAAVGAKRINRVWVAFAIEFDVQSFRDTPTLSGVIVRVTPNGRRLIMQLGNGTSRWVTIVPRTIFRIDGKLQALPPLLQKGELVDVKMRLTGNVWVALEIDLTLNPTSVRRVS